MSAPITEAHREAAVAIFAIAMKSAHHGAAFREPCAQLIADSEARACDQLRTEVEELKESILVQRIFSDYRQRAERAEAELATERARLDWLEDHGWLTGEPCDRAAIDAAMKEGAK